MASLIGGLRRVSLISVVTVGLVAPVIAFAETESLDFLRKEAQYRGPGKFTWAAIARDRDDLRRLWDRFNQRGPLPFIRFKKNVGVLAGSGGSSSCRLRLHDLRLNREHQRIVVRVYQNSGGGECTDDWVPRTFTLAVERADLKPLNPRDASVRTRRIEDSNP